MVNPEFVDDEFHDVPTIKPVEDPEMYTYRWNLSFKHVRPSETVMDPLSTSSNKRCIDMFMGFEDVPCEVASMIIRVMDPPTEDLPTILQVRRKGSLWFTYVLNDLDVKAGKCQQYQHQEGRIDIRHWQSGCSKGTWDRVIRSQKELVLFDFYVDIPTT
jgi:hypothetical protein